MRPRPADTATSVPPVTLPPVTLLRAGTAPQAGAARTHTITMTGALPVPDAPRLGSGGTPGAPASPPRPAGE
ncbi:hypothetical protein [Streptomyces sp. NPDC056387]|uniref:hypothetical protein n=1 Tax=Streptomyces sp. NPDC056387 TaxID=3345803 RepID=UPI0035DB296E